MVHFALPKSSIIRGLEWLSERIPYPEADVKGDTFPMTWADDDEIYTSAGDPLWGETTSGLDVQKFSGMAPDYKITKVHHMNSYLGWGGDGAKPSGMICVDGILYLAFQNMLGARRPVYGLRSQHGSDAQIVYAINDRQIWIPALSTISAPMFPGAKFGGPAFIWLEPDGVTGWLQFSGSWGPHGQTAGYYRSNVRRFRLIVG